MKLILRNLSHHYGDVQVLNDINLEIETGQILCVVGPSGCGKSTLLRLLGGLEEPAAGSVTQQGALPDDCLNALTYIFQDFALLPWRTVQDNVRLALEDHGLDHASMQSVIDDVLVRTRLSEFRDALPKQISGGMKQRVAIARALAVNPAVLLMDEPLSALDSQTRELLIDDLVDLWERQHFTSVYVTHNLAEAVRLGHRIVVMSRRPGEIREIVDLERPLGERNYADAELDARQKYLWDLMREEARAADAELLNV